MPPSQLSPSQKKHVNDTLSTFAELYDGPNPVTKATLEAQAARSSASLVALGFATGQGLFGIKTDWSKAVKLYAKAAAAGQASAYRMLAGCLRSGAGTRVDRVHAAELDNWGAELGDKSAMFNTALNQQEGKDGVRQDLAAAAEWYRKGAAGGSDGNVACMINLGIMYEKGSGVAQSWPEALQLYTQAAIVGTPAEYAAVGAINAANCHTNGWGTEVDHEQAVELLLRGMQLGSGKAAFMLAECHETGQGVDVDLLKAESLYAFAGEHGVPDGIFRLANFMYNGWGARQDQAGAMVLYEEAQRLGSRQAGAILAMLHLMETMGTPRPVRLHPSDPNYVAEGDEDVQDEHFQPAELPPPAYPTYEDV